VRSPVSAAVANAYIPDGESSLAGLFRNVGEGIYVTDVQGLHAGLNPVSGDFSCAARGCLIHEGVKSQALRNFTISGNFYEIIRRLSGRANDRRKDDPMRRFSSPALFIEKLDISGK
jgi:PmbA protein